MHDGSCWDQVIEEFNRQGHVAYAPTMAGHGEDAGNFFKQADCVKSVVDYILERDIRDFILAGHSFAGIVIPNVAEQLSDRINRVVFQNAMVMEDGECIYDVIPPGYQQMFDALIKKDGENANWLLSFELFRERFINDADLETAKEVFARLRPVCVYSQKEKNPDAGLSKTTDSPGAISTSPMTRFCPMETMPGIPGWRTAWVYAGWCKSRAAMKSVIPTRKSWPRR